MLYYSKCFLHQLSKGKHNTFIIIIKHQCRMDRKSKESETIYPDLFFSIDDFEQVRVGDVAVTMATNGYSVSGKY